MDAEKLFKELNVTADPDRCARESGVDCTTANCHWRCALDVIDELLARADDVSGDEVDRLLDLRSQLRRRDDAEAALRLFCELRLQMEQRHYLAFFRIRRWMENHLVATVRLGLSEPRTIRVKLDHYCVIAVRRACLCACLGPDTALVAPRFEFAFRPAISAAAAEAALQKG